MMHRKKPRPIRQHRGVGDTVQYVAHHITFGVSDNCQGCDERAEDLNKLLPYKREPEVRR